MQLKTYQQNAMEKLDLWLETIQVLEESGAEAPEELKDFPARAWGTLKKQQDVPGLKQDDGSFEIPDYIPRTTASGQSIPHVCLKVPTGGGKTLLGVSALERLKADTGFVLWIVPTRAIYEQTLAAFKAREHPYRQMLDRISGKKLKLLEKSDRFTQHDVRGYLCVMMLMLPSANRQKGREFLKIFRDSGHYASFFPEQDDALANAELAERYGDLEKNSASTQVKQSLINVLKLIRPTVILDEAHKAYGTNDRSNKEFVKSVNRLNPRFVLELSATPKAGISNILVNISGVELQHEEMIKLPVEIRSSENSRWQYTLEKAHKQLKQLERTARELQSKGNRYIRPIAVVRVERTDKQGDGLIHADDAKKYLTHTLRVPEHHIRKQTSSEKELSGENLLSEDCPVRWIITKDALKEGWDCAFAYLLVLLDNTTANTAITQLVGRVMRQPQASLVQGQNYDSLNRCYIHCFNTNVRKAIEHVKTSLENEGLTDLGNAVIGTGKGAPQKKTIQRRKQYQGEKIFLPQVLHKDGSGWREIDYDRDVLSAIDWSTIGAGQAINLDDPKIQREIIATINARGSDDIISEKRIDTGERVNLDYFVRRLAGTIPNPWQAARVAEAFLEKHREHGETELLNNRLYLSDQLVQHVMSEVEARAESAFRGKVRTDDIRFYLETDENLNYSLEGDSFEIIVGSDDHVLHKEHNEIQLSLFTPLFESSFNGLEQDFALYLDRPEAFHWWHRIAARQAYYLQGWRRHRVYPDFIATAKKDGKLMVMETKGLHLKGNDDTKYKEKLLRTLEGAYQRAHDRGKMKAGNPPAVFRMMFEDNWKGEVNELAPPYKTS